MASEYTDWASGDIHDGRVFLPIDDTQIDDEEQVDVSGHRYHENLSYPFETVSPIPQWQHLSDAYSNRAPNHIGTYTSSSTPILFALPKSKSTYQPPKEHERRGKGIRIVDPSSNIDITDAIQNIRPVLAHQGPSNSSASSTSKYEVQTHTPNEDARAKRIQASFYAQVVSAAAEDTGGSWKDYAEGRHPSEFEEQIGKYEPADEGITIEEFRKTQRALEAEYEYEFPPLLLPSASQVDLEANEGATLSVPKESQKYDEERNSYASPPHHRGFHERRYKNLEIPGSYATPGCAVVSMGIIPGETSQDTVRRTYAQLNQQKLKSNPLPLPKGMLESKSGREEHVHLKEKEILQQNPNYQPTQLKSEDPTMLPKSKPIQWLPTKERKIIRIVDPLSNTDITDAILRGRDEVENSSASCTPPPTPQNDQLASKIRAIQASFAAQVALAAAANTNLEKTARESVSRTEPTEPSLPQNHPSSDKARAIQASFAAQVALAATDAHLEETAGKSLSGMKTMAPSWHKNNQIRNEKARAIQASFAAQVALAAADNAHWKETSGRSNSGTEPMAPSPPQKHQSSNKAREAATSFSLDHEEYMSESESGPQLSTQHMESTPYEIRTRGPAALAAYKKAIESGKKPVYRTRVMLVGQERAGKTSLKKRLIGERFDPSEPITDGIDPSSMCSIDVDQSINWKVSNFNESSGKYQEALAEHIAIDLQKQDSNDSPKSSPSMSPDSHLQEDPVEDDDIRSMKAAEEVENYPASAALSSLDKDAVPWSEESQAYKESSAEVETIFANLSLETKEPALVNMPRIEPVQSEVRSSEQPLLVEMPDELSKAVAGKLEQGLNTSEEKEVSFGIWDFAGQELYYTTHQVFLSRRAVTIVVFKLTEAFVEGKLDKHFLDNLDFWMQSVYAFTSADQEEQNEWIENLQQDQLSPPIIIVATHKNSLSHIPAQRNMMVDEVFETIENSLNGKCYGAHVVRDFFAVENSIDDYRIAELRSRITAIVEKEPYMGEEIPLRWLKFEESVKEVIQQGTHYMTIEEVEKLDGAKDIPASAPDELKTMLQFYHDLGVILFHPLAKPPLQDLVILNPRWLIDVFKSVITVLDRKKRRAVDANAWARLESEGILEDSLITYMWKSFIGNGPDSKQMKSALVELMEKYDLLVKQECSSTSEQNGASSKPSSACYYVPARLEATAYRNADAVISEGSTVFYLNFFSFLPGGIVYRLLARVLEWSQRQGEVVHPPALRSFMSTFYADDYHQLTLQVILNCIMVCVVPAQIVGDALRTRTTACPKTTAKVKSFLEESLANIKKVWAPRIQYALCVACPCESGDQHYLELDRVLSEESRNVNVQCCRGRRIAKQPIKKMFTSQQDQPSPSQVPRQKSCYKLQHNPRGICCIIDNSNFDLARELVPREQLSDRPGSDKDSEDLRKTFSMLGFTVDIAKNLTADGMLYYLQQQADKHAGKSVDCFVCCVLTHGKLDHLYGVDGATIKILEAMNIFKGCPALVGKPKLFFVQACRGLGRQRGAHCVEEDSPNKNLMDGPTSIPVEADFLLGFSTVPGYVSYRNTTLGSWYIRTLTEVINKYCTSLHILEILTLVNEKLSEKDTGDEGRYKQIAAPVYTLRKLLYLTPPDNH